MEPVGCKGGEALAALATCQPTALGVPNADGGRQIQPRRRPCREHPNANGAKPRTPDVKIGDMSDDLTVMGIAVTAAADGFCGERSDWFYAHQA